MCHLPLSSAFPYVLAFFDGAFSINSGGRAEEKDLAKHTEMELQTAEKELTQVWEMFHILPGVLGAMADTGYTLWAQDPEDDEQKPLLVYKLLQEH